MKLIVHCLALLYTKITWFCAEKQIASCGSLLPAFEVFNLAARKGQLRSKEAREWQLRERERERERESEREREREREREISIDHY